MCLHFVTDCYKRGPNGRLAIWLNMSDPLKIITK